MKAYALVSMALLAGVGMPGLPTLQEQLNSSYKEPQQVHIVGENGLSIGTVNRETGRIFIINPDRGPSIGSVDKDGNIKIIEGMRLD